MLERSKGAEIRTTYSCAILEISTEAYAEIERELKAVGYEHAFNRL